MSNEYAGAIFDITKYRPSAVNELQGASDTALSVTLGYPLLPGRRLLVINVQSIAVEVIYTQICRMIRKKQRITIKELKHGNKNKQRKKRSRNNNDAK